MYSTSHTLPDKPVYNIKMCSLHSFTIQTAPAHMRIELWPIRATSAKRQKQHSLKQMIWVPFSAQLSKESAKSSYSEIDAKADSNDNCSLVTALVVLHSRSPVVIMLLAHPKDILWRKEIVIGSTKPERRPTKALWCLARPAKLFATTRVRLDF